MKISKVLVVWILLAWKAPAIAGIQPSFDLGRCTWTATDIVVVTEGEQIDGNFTVLETWKGSLKADDTLSIPELAEFVDEKERTVSTVFVGKREKLPTHVSGAKMVLFLKKPLSTPLLLRGKWRPTGYWEQMWVSTVWIEDGQVFWFDQPVNPGPSLLRPHGTTEEQLKASVGKKVGTQAGIAAAASLPNPTERAQTLRPFANTGDLHATQMVFDEMLKCGKVAVPVLRAMLSDPTQAWHRAWVLRVFTQAVGTSGASEITNFLIAETAFWKQRAPKLKRGWLVDTGEVESESGILWSRYLELSSVLDALKPLKYHGCKTAVLQLRDFWRSHPQLNDEAPDIANRCDDILKAIPATPAPPKKPRHRRS